MKPGIYYDVPFDEYQSWPALHQSALKSMAVPKRYAYELDHPMEVTPAMVLGSALHCRVLERDRFEREYLPHPKIDKRSKKWEAFCNARDPERTKKLVPEEVNDMANALWEIPALGVLLTDKASRVEVSMFWHDEELDVDFKGRLDVLNDELQTVVDLKTTRSASAGGFAAEVFKHSYQMQAALYMRGLKALGVAVTDFLFFAVETKAPFLCAGYRLIDEVIALGEAQLAEYVRRYKECLKSNVWPGYPSEIQAIGVPAWNLKQLEEEYEE